MLFTKIVRIYSIYAHFSNCLKIFLKVRNTLFIYKKGFSGFKIILKLIWNKQLRIFCVIIMLYWRNYILHRSESKINIYLVYSRPHPFFWRYVWLYHLVETFLDNLRSNIIHNDKGVESCIYATIENLGIHYQSISQNK